MGKQRKWVVLIALVLISAGLVSCGADLMRVYPLSPGDFRLQQLDNSCGLAALTYVLEKQGIPILESDLRREIELSHKGATLEQLHHLAESKGMIAQGWRMNLPHLARQPMPAIAHFKDHFVVVERVDKDWVIVADPSIGRLKMSHRAFLWRWDGIVLTVASREVAG